ncbi:hypothetical protein PTTG_28566, partial [Puccinia triticina 1-1 BBBD Race 1]
GHSSHQSCALITRMVNSSSHLPPFPGQNESHQYRFPVFLGHNLFAREDPPPVNFIQFAPCRYHEASLNAEHLSYLRWKHCQRNSTLSPSTLLIGLSFINSEPASQEIFILFRRCST